MGGGGVGLLWLVLCYFKGSLFCVKKEPQTKICASVDLHCFCLFCLLVLLLRQWENAGLCHSNDSFSAAVAGEEAYPSSE